MVAIRVRGLMKNAIHKHPWRIHDSGNCLKGRDKSRIHPWMRPAISRIFRAFVRSLAVAWRARV
jgi:hypothetical protein